MIESHWKTLTTQAEYNEALKRTVKIFNAEKNTPDGNELDLLLPLIWLMKIFTTLESDPLKAFNSEQ